MKKFVYLCGMMLLSMNMMAQIDLNDKNWDTVFIEDFSGMRYWDSIVWEDRDSSNSSHVPRWICFTDNLWGSGVTWYDKEKNKCHGYQAYQRENAIFGTDSTLKLRGQFKSHTPLHCDSIDGYKHAPWYKYCHYCDSFEDQHPKVHYFSGTIETIDTVGYGYYEIKCKLPVGRGTGTFNAFWFWGDFEYYEEIDVFEHSEKFCVDDIEKGFIAGIFYNPNGPEYYTEYDSTGAITVQGADHYSYKEYLSPASSKPLDEYHTYGCLWLPERVAWYFDGELFNEETDPSHIPQHPMWIKINHYEDDFAFASDSTWWQGSDEMTIDYVKAYRLKTNCNTDAVIRSQSDFNGFVYNVKRSITLGSLNSTTLAIADTSNFTMRAVESITIDGAFEVPVGACMTLITQECPQCSTDGVVMPLHNCGINEPVE